MHFIAWMTAGRLNELKMAGTVSDALEICRDVDLKR
jgi:hypothetical protein